MAGLFLLAAAASDLTTSELQADSHPTGVAVHAVRVTDRPVIDGLLTDAVWSLASVTDNFRQREPVEGDPPTERTEVRIVYDDRAIYFGIRCYDSQAHLIVANRMRRDGRLSEDDHVSIILDTYDDRRGGFYFSTNPLGAQRDALLSDEGRTLNEAWDCVWECRSRRDARGWSAEVAIPFDQLRYAESDDAVWGVNVGRIIARKNEEVYLVPAPQSFGFFGAYRTSVLASLRGLGALRSRRGVEVTPYVLPGSERDLDALDPTEQNFLDAGVDVKYGVTPSLTLDLSYNTDFAQVESDREEVNLTRFSLFLPEKRDFFLEGAGVFAVGERSQRFGGRPPTVLFYSRRIGIQEGHPLPVTYGTRLTGRAGAYEIGLLNVMTDPGLFHDEVEEDRFVTDTGDLLDEDAVDLLLAGGAVTIVDTIEVDVIDTVDAARTVFTVARVRRDLFERSAVGLLVADRSPGEEGGHNRTLGVDADLSFAEGAANVRGFAARTWSDDLHGKDRAAFLEFERRAANTDANLSYLDVQENFNPEIGFVPREDIRRFKGSVRYRPRPQTAWIRQYSMGPQLTYTLDQDNQLQTRDVAASIFINTEAGDWMGVEFQDRFEYLDEPFEIHEDIEIPEGDYTFRQVGVRLFLNDSRRLGGNARLSAGQFFDGNRTRIAAEIQWKASSRLSIESDYEINRVDLPVGDFTTNRWSNRLLFTFTPDLFVRGFVQWNSAREVIGADFLLNYRYLPGSDLFLVYNQVWDTEGGLTQKNRSIQLKLAYFWQPRRPFARPSARRNPGPTLANSHWGPQTFQGH